MTLHLVLVGEPRVNWGGGGTSGNQCRFRRLDFVSHLGSFDLFGVKGRDEVLRAESHGERAWTHGHLTLRND